MLVDISNIKRLYANLYSFIHHSSNSIMITEIQIYYEQIMTTAKQTYYSLLIDNID